MNYFLGAMLCLLCLWNVLDVPKPKGSVTGVNNTQSAYCYRPQGTMTDDVTQLCRTLKHEREA